MITLRILMSRLGLYHSYHMIQTIRKEAKETFSWRKEQDRFGTTKNRCLTQQEEKIPPDMLCKLCPFWAKFFCFPTGKTALLATLPTEEISSHYKP